MCMMHAQLLDCFHKQLLILGWFSLFSHVAVLLDEAAVVLRARGSMDGSPAVLAEIPEAVDVATEVGSIAASAVHSMALVTHLVVQHIWLYLHL